MYVQTNVASDIDLLFKVLVTLNSFIISWCSYLINSNNGQLIEGSAISWMNLLCHLVPPVEDAIYYRLHR